MVRTALALDGVDIVMRLTDHPDGEAIVRTGPRRAALHGRAATSRTCAASAGASTGDLAALDLDRGRRRLRSATYPDALGRIWSALRCRQSGELLLSAAPGYEFTDWGGGGHVGGGSHGSLHANDSHGVLLWAGGDRPAADSREQWSLRDITPMILDHFGVAGVTTAAAVRALRNPAHWMQLLRFCARRRPAATSSTSRSSPPASVPATGTVPRRSRRSSSP